MKKTYLRNAICLIFTSVAAVACYDVVNIDEGWDDDMGSDGAPVIRKITASADTSTVISTASLDQSIAVFGDNLAYVEEIKINDIEVDLSEVYAKKHRLEMVIPRVLPGEVNNTLYIRTTDGEVSASLEVVLPQLTISGFSNEFAADGDTVRLVGTNFDLYQIDSVNAKVQLNGQDIKIFDCTSTSVSLQVPDGTPEDVASSLSIQTPQVETPVQIPFRDEGIPILTDDPNTHLMGPWFAKTCLNLKDNPDAEPEAPLFDWYVIVKGTYTGAWQYDNVFITHFYLDETARDLVNNPEDYVVKFELYTPALVPMARYVKIGFAEDDHGFIYDWDPSASNGGVSLNTMDQWQTISLEVTDLFCKDGQCYLKISENPYVGADYNNFKMAVNRELAGDVEFYCWNFRFAKKIVL
ncbi:MAG: hypothetical protein IAB75_05120 [Bacteroidetes bacterium]|uniref:Surface glycan-binding protein B xyloglucan binding domain-containing protein n=1 Tax=Candidatus Cryptobacteroides avicola TaxID=2840757 RepID=A0A940II76_9BACT|nr:hypothetical protein [Candidatus Cryptobacteroides avicola]